MTETTILVLLGSLRKESINRRLAELAVESAPPGLTLEPFDRLAELPFYDEDADGAEVADAVSALRAAAAAAGGVLAVTPEYNGSIPAVLKNAIDWLSRPYGASPIKGKPTVVIGTSVGQYGGSWAHDESRKSFGIAGARVVEDVELSIPSKAFDGKHPRENAEIAGQLRGVLQHLAAAVERRT